VVRIPLNAPVPFRGTQRQKNGLREQELGGRLRYGALGAEAMITATWTWTDIRNFEEDPSRYQRSQLAWALVLVAALILVTALLG
jgi:heme A synthase